MTQRSHLKRLADRRLKDARALMTQRRYTGAYYIAGYAVECGIKACIATQFKRNTIPDKTLVNKTYSHDFEKLLKTAGIFDELEQDIQNNLSLYSSWNVVKDWRPEIRYTISITRVEARDLIEAIGNPHDGILSWLKRYW